MISITINGVPALIKAGSKFEFVRENKLFESSDGYSFEMEFPLRDCSQNVEAFGYLNLMSADIPTELVPCVISSGKISLKGSVSVMSVDEASVKVQFLQGVDSGESAKLLESTFINDLDLGEYPYTDPALYKAFGQYNGAAPEVCLPWVYGDSDIMNNERVFKEINSSGTVMIDWSEDTKYLTWQPNLLHIVDRILENIGYSLSGPEWNSLRNTEWKNAVICNTLPPTWRMPQYAKALPDWSVLEFFENLGKLFKGNFVFDHIEKSISFKRNLVADTSDQQAKVVVPDLVSSQFNATVSRDEQDAGFLPDKKYRFSKDGHDVWKFWDCPEFLKYMLTYNSDEILTFDSWKDAMPNILSFTPYNRFNNNRGNFAGSVVYIKDLDTYFLMRANFCPADKFASDPNIPKKYALFAQMTPLNIFGPDPLLFDESDNYEDIDIVPVTVDWNNCGFAMILPQVSLDDEEKELPGYKPGEQIASLRDPEMGWSVMLTDSPEYYQSRKGQQIENQAFSKSKSPAYYDKIFIGFASNELYTSIAKFPNWIAPANDLQVVLSDLKTMFKGMLRLNKGWLSVKGGVSIDQKVMYEFTLVSKDIPDIDSVFVINGKKYVCRKLTCSFSDNGKSDIIKGEFYRIRE